MNSYDILQEFRRKRKLLDNLGEQHATERLSAMWQFLENSDKTHQITNQIYEENQELLDRIKKGEFAKAGPEAEIVVVGFYVMEACYKGEGNQPVNSIAKSLGIVSHLKMATRQSYVDDAMNGYVYHALDYIDRELERIVKKEAKYPRGMNGKSLKPIFGDEESSEEGKQVSNDDNRVILEKIQNMLEVQLEKVDNVGHRKQCYAMTRNGFISGLGLNKCIDNQKLTKLIELLPSLKKLNTLFLSENNLTDILPLRLLNGLTTLDLSKNKLSNISPLKGFKTLTTLYLSYNKLTDVSPLSSLINLKTLTLYHNQIDDISPLLPLKTLIRLDLHSNMLKEIKPDFFQLGCDDIYWEDKDFTAGLNLYGNPLESPPVEVIEQGKEAVLKYFSEKKTSRAYPEGVNGVAVKKEDAHNVLQTAFIEFLNAEEKGYPIDSIKELSGGELLISEKYSLKTIAFIDFTSSNEHSVITRAIDNLRLSALPGLVGYLVCATSDYSSKDFEIIKVEENSYETISIKGFPDYEELALKFSSKLFDLYYPLLATESKQFIESGRIKAEGIGQDKPLTTSSLIFGMIELGKSKESGLITANFLRDRILKRTTDEKIDNLYSIYKYETEGDLFKWKTIITSQAGSIVDYIPYILEDSVKFAEKTTGKRMAEGRHLLAALLLFIQSAKGIVTGAERQLRDLMGEDAVEWAIKGFPEHLKQFDDNQDAWAEILNVRPGTVVKKNNSVNKFCIGDSETHVDTLGFKPYVEAVANFLTHEKTELPLTLSVEGEWGSGKSSFMLQLQDAIKVICNDNEINDENSHLDWLGDVPFKIVKWFSEKRRKAFSRDNCLIVEFEPWRHDKDDALWAAFALKFISDIAKRIGWWNRVRANLKLWKQRYDFKKAWPDVLRVISLSLIWVLVTVAICKMLWEGVELGTAGKIVLPKYVGSIVAVLVSLWGALGKVKDFLGTPLSVDLKKYMKRPDYVSKVSFIDRFHEDFRKIIKAYAGNKKVFVFIEDLDRCKVPKSAELMESINLMFSKEPNLVFVMGMDREKVAAGLAVRHEKLLPYLSSEAEAEMKDGNCKRRWGVRYGYSFIEKFVQVPFLLPMPNKDSIERMLESLSGEIQSSEDLEQQKQAKKEEFGGDFTGHENAEDEINEAIEKAEKKEVEEEVESEEREIRMEEVQVKFELQPESEGDSSSFRNIVLMVSEALNHNPRRVKQFMNIFRLQATIAASLNKLKPDNSEGVEFEQLGKFVAIQLACPLFMKDVEVEPKLFERIVEIVEDRHDVKETNEESEKVRHWCKDKKLMDLFKIGNKTKDWDLYSLFKVDVTELLRVYGTIGSGSDNIS